MDRQYFRKCGGKRVALALNLIEVHIPLECAPERADKLLAKCLQGMTGWQLHAAFLRKDVKRNGQRITAQMVLYPGDTVRIYTPYASDAHIACIHQDDEYVVLHKMPGLEVQGPVSVESIASRQFGVPLMACHRLDVQTGGLLLLAKTEAAFETAKQNFAAHTIAKTYRALVCGCPSPQEATLHAYLRKDSASAMVYVTGQRENAALPIETRYRVIVADERDFHKNTQGEDGTNGIAADEGYSHKIAPDTIISRVEIELITGRTHQIRAHMAFIGHPVLGDDKYGDRACNKAYGVHRQMLWCVKLVLWDGRAFAVQEGF